MWFSSFVKCCLRLATLMLLIALSNGDDNNVARRTQECEGYFCDNFLDTMFILMTHNSYASEEDDMILPSQKWAEPRQYLDGIRGFAMDVYNGPGGRVILKHGSIPGEIDYATRVKEILNVLQPNDFILIQLEDHLSTPDGACLPWGDKLIKNFDPNKRLGHYISKGQQVLLLTQKTRNVRSSIGMHNSNLLLAENDYGWTSVTADPNMSHRRGPTGGGGNRYAKMLNYFCTDTTIQSSSRQNANEVNGFDRMQCHARQFMRQSYSQGTINVIMVDFYHLPKNGPNALDVQDAFRRGNYGNFDGQDCVPAEQTCPDPGSGCGKFGSCRDCCYGSNCAFMWIFKCKCN